MELLPCPFCGSNNLGFAQGSTHRWLSVICHDCGAASGEVRKEILCSEFTVGDKQRATEEWNRRTSPASVPEGYALVPVEPTDEMCGAAYNDRMVWNGGPRAIYEAMLAAAPTPPVQGDRKDAERYRWLLPRLVAWQNKDFENAFLHHTHGTIEEAIDKAMEGK